MSRDEREVLHLLALAHRRLDERGIPRPRPVVEDK